MSVQYIIEPQKEGKGRSFVGSCLAIVRADGLFPEADNQTIRPVWAMFAGTDQELKPFMANLWLGRKADKGTERKKPEHRIEFLKSVKYQIGWQREPEGTLATIYHPELFRPDPGMVDPEGINFVVLVPEDWAATQECPDQEAAIQHVLKLGCKLELLPQRYLVQAAYLFAAYLDRRTRCPLVADGRFYLQLLTMALNLGLASLPYDELKSYGSRNENGRFTHHGFRQEGLSNVGICQAISFRSSHQTFETFLAEQVEIFFKNA